MSKILFIAYTFPPIPYGGTYRALRLCRGFAEKDFECHVLTIKEYEDIPNDYGLLNKVPNAIHTHRTTIIDPWRRYQAIKKEFSGKFWFKIVNKFISLLLRPIAFPDHMLLWTPFAVLKARRLIRQHNIENVLISSPPDSSQLIGWVLKKFLNIYWIADFRDPIYGNVAQVDMINPTRLIDRFQKKMLIKYDQLIANTADVLIANTETHAQMLRENYGCMNVHVIRNSYDPLDFSNTNNKKYPLFTIAHVGSIYGKRNPDLLFAAVKQLASEYAPETLRLQIVFLGLGGNSLYENVERYGIGEYVKIKTQIPHQEAIEFMYRSHLLLLVKATGKWSNGQIPGKFFEYIGSRNPVLCIGPVESEVAELIKTHELGYVVENNLDTMTSVLRNVYKRYIESGALFLSSKEQVSEFSSAIMVEKMFRVFK
ncbi:MAG: glycosyltransferase family 4 protein [Bacteroidetes bacterium]|nr:glycosyltransferase family 4 protein [Bacteroidota bacterium]